MKKQPKSYVLYMGIIIFVVGLLLKFLIPASDGALQALPFVLTGFGAGIIGVGVVNIFRKRMIDNNPQKAKQYDINEKDERNIRIREKAGYATWYTTLFVLSAISLTFAVLDYKVASFISIGALFIHIISLFLYIYIYNKKI
jgi:hypothetical protein